MRATLTAALLLLTATPALAEADWVASAVWPPTDIRGVAPGNSEVQASVALGKIGKITQEPPTADKTYVLVAGDVRVAICKGVVTNVTKILGPDFLSFALLARAATVALGAPKTDVEAITYSGKDRTGPPYELTISWVRQSWKDFMIIYTKENTNTMTSETIGEVHPCS